MHNHERSRSRASNSSTRAGKEIVKTQVEIEVIGQKQAQFTDAVSAINQACLAGNHGKELTGEGLDRVRRDMQKGLTGPTDFNAARGA